MEDSPNVGHNVVEPLAPAPTTPVRDEQSIAQEETSEEMTPPKQQTSTRVIADAKIDTLAKGVSAKVTAAFQTRAAIVEEEETLKKHRDELRKERKRVARELRNHAKRRRRLVSKAKNLSTQELLDVWHMREERAPKSTSSREEALPR